MSITDNFFPINDKPLITAQFKSTHYAEGVLYDPFTGIGFTGATGKFSLWYEGTEIIVNRSMTNDGSMPDGWVRCLVTHTEIGQWGYYSWVMTMTTADGSYTLTENGEFTL